MREGRKSVGMKRRKGLGKVGVGWDGGWEAQDGEEGWGSRFSGLGFFL